MGRTKKKPGYDQNRIMEQFQNCIVEAYTSGMIDGSGISLRQVSEEFGITLMKTRKILITAGVYHTVNGNEIQINRKKKSITRSSVKVALKVTLEEKGNISGPKKLEVFGASYLYSMFLRFGLIDTERNLNGYLPDMDNI